jgi:glycosyltransferase involved in cell wall biosynthesis
VVAVCVNALVSDQSGGFVVKVLHVIPSVAERSGGPAAAIVPMCKALQAEGIDVSLVTTSHGLTRMNTDSKVYKGVPARFFPVQIGASFKYSRPLASWLNANVRDFDLVHVHAVFNHASVAAAKACRKAGVPYIVRPLGTLDPWSLKQKPARKKIFWSLAGKRMLECSAAVHYTAAGEKAATEGHLGINHGQVISLGVEVDETSPRKRAADYFPVLSGQKYVLQLSRLDPKKRVEILIDAFKARENGAWRLVIAGDGPREYVSTLKQRARGLEKIVFTGWVEGEQKEALLRDASLFVLPSRHENFGLSVMEAMARGVPVLVSPHVNLAREIKAADAGWIVDLDRLGDGLTIAFQNESERVRRGKAAQQFSRAYTWQRTARELAELYRQIA